MRRCSTISKAWLWLAWAGLASAHDFWVDAETLFPPPGTELRVWVTGGHRFPEPELTLRSRLIQGVDLVDAGGRGTPIAVEPGADRRHRGSVTLPAVPGVYRLEVVIGDPRRPKPGYLGRALIISQGAVHTPADYRCNDGIEIAPGVALIGRPPDGLLPVSVFKDGQPIPAVLTLYPAGGRPLRRTATALQPALFPVEPGRKQLFTTTVGGVPRSLVLAIRDVPPNE